MLLFPLPALLTPFPRIFIIKGNVNNERIFPSCLFPAPLTHFPVIAFINKGATGFINEKITKAVIGANTGPRNPPS